MRRQTAGASVLTVVNAITKQLIVNLKIITNQTSKLKERTKLQPQIRIRKRRVKKQPLIMQIPKKKMKVNLKRKFLRMTLQENITLKK